jgi:hypothetical protein
MYVYYVLAPLGRNKRDSDVSLLTDKCREVSDVLLARAPGNPSASASELARLRNPTLLPLAAGAGQDRRRPQLILPLRSICHHSRRRIWTAVPEEPGRRPLCQVNPTGCVDAI